MTGLPHEALFLEQAMARYSLTKEGERLHLPQEMEGAFLGETVVDFPQERSPTSGFFWQRLAAYVNDKEPLYYRMGVDPERLQEPLRSLLGHQKLLLFWLRVQFEAHQLIEKPITCAVSAEGVQKLPTDTLLDQGAALKGAKIYFTPEELKRRTELLQEHMGRLLEGETQSIQHTMGETLRDELGRIREYYSHLLAKTQKPEERERLTREQLTLEQEHIRRLHPSALKIVLVPELLVALTAAP